MNQKYINYIQSLNDENVRKVVRENVRDYRINVLQITQGALGEAMGLSKQSIHGYERGTIRMNIGFVLTFSAVTGASMESLFRDRGTIKIAFTLEERMKMWEKS